MRAAASRTFWTAGRSRPIRMAMMAMTTSSSIRVKADRRVERFMDLLRHKGNDDQKDHNRTVRGGADGAPRVRSPALRNPSERPRGVSCPANSGHERVVGGNR